MNSSNPSRQARRRGLPGLESLEARQLLDASREILGVSAATLAQFSKGVTAPRVFNRGHVHTEGLSAARAAVASSASGVIAGKTSGTDLSSPEVAGYYGNGSVPMIGPGQRVPYYPSQVADAYGFDQLANQGQGQTIAIVDAYDDPNIASDLAQFSRTFGLPQMDGRNGDPTFTKLTPQGQPTGDMGWGLEISLDVEWIHAMAPLANIDLVESINNNDSNGQGQGLYPAVQYAASLPGVTVVSNSYGGGESAGETAGDPFFTTPSGHNPVAFTVSTGDSGAPGGYPAFSPNVVAIGGTSLYTLSTKGKYAIEYAWSGGGGGVSQYESAPSYQSKLNYSGRAIPDISLVADPSTGVFVYDSYESGGGGFYAVGGTSVSSPIAAAMIGLADQARSAKGSLPISSLAIDTALYNAYGSTSYLTDFHDITSGSNGNSAGTGYDLATGIGSPKVPQVVQLLSTV